MGYELGNFVIITTSAEKRLSIESCASVPNMTGVVVRSQVNLNLIQGS